MKIEYEVYVEFEEEEYTVNVEAVYRKGSPEVRYLRNGDPGYPAEPPEIEITKVTCPECKELETTEDPSIIDQIMDQGWITVDESLDRDDI